MYQQDTFQFYATTKELGRKVWAKFKNTAPTRILEPSAGDGALLRAHPKWSSRSVYQFPSVDAIEIDITKHAALREEGVNVVGIDFLTFTNGAMYSHIVMNPPFSQGARHVLHAWDVLWDGEIVAIINAETLRNPFSKERQMLCRLIEEHGDFEYIQDAFKGPEVVRETSVEVALVYLRKSANLEQDLFADMIDGLSIDKETGEGLAAQFESRHEVALPNSEIENRVATLNAAVRTMQAAVFAEAKARHYARLLGKTMAEYSEERAASSHKIVMLDYVRKETAERYGKLKDAAWAGILRSADVTSRLSSHAQRRVESEFEQIKKLEFNTRTIYGFLLGIVESHGQIQIDMACDVFDAITRYHTENTIWYKGWKSNDKHHAGARKIKTTRFINPRNIIYGNNLCWESVQMLRDYDKVFAMLDGKAAPEVSLESIFNNHLRELRNGQRLSSSYFDVRFYPLAGTIHFFPNKKKNLVDRLNRMVGRHRQWLPPKENGVSKNFWVAYDLAEKLDSAVRKKVAEDRENRWVSPFHRIDGSNAESQQRAAAEIESAIEAALEAYGVSPHFQALEDPTEQHHPIALAA